MTVTQSDPLVHRWTDLPSDQPMDLITRRRVVGKNMMLSHVTLEKGFCVETHDHANEQLAIVLSGKIRFGLGEPGSDEYREVVLEGGEVMELPSNLPHRAEALETTVIIDAFSPPSESTGVDER